MTPYQRGYRDAALLLAKQLEAEIREGETLLQRCREEATNAHPENVASLYALTGQIHHRHRAVQWCHRLALAAAEALPDDPEAP